MDTRRDVLKKLLFGATALPVGAAAATVAAKDLVAPAPEAALPSMEWLEHALANNPEARQFLAKLATAESGPAPWHLFAPLEAGSELALGWKIKDLSPVELGGTVMTLKHKRGYETKVHFCKKSEVPKGITHTSHFDVFLMNGGDGDTASEEELGRVVLTLGEVVRQNEDRKPELRKLASGMLSHDERVDLFGPESLLS